MHNCKWHLHAVVFRSKNKKAKNVIKTISEMRISNFRQTASVCVFTIWYEIRFDSRNVSLAIYFTKAHWQCEHFCWKYMQNKKKRRERESSEENFIRWRTESMLLLNSIIFA